ncbi:hypothetical protein [Paeniglutamicibacter terrestris]|uniref:MFS transporter n=1 Tax=Paeniglutamicibacter terrestris TaxID=2723403 RepID=A0ABX1G0A6_9MICC|nr:hypothetical protein [Paeniglutamicibacter terrestris]NKG19125.1 hypothetical protein [Paeniglutamicibacter terrestris]
MVASSSQAIKDRPTVTLGLSTGFTLLVSAGMLFARYVVHAMFFTITSFNVFVVAFLSAPLFAHVQISWPTRAAVLGTMIG